MDDQGNLNIPIWMIKEILITVLLIFFIEYIYSTVSFENSKLISFYLSSKYNNSRAAKFYVVLM